jgi:hypothetical protein
MQVKDLPAECLLDNGVQEPRLAADGTWILRHGGGAAPSRPIFN